MGCYNVLAAKWKMGRIALVVLRYLLPFNVIHKLLVKMTRILWIQTYAVFLFLEHWLNIILKILTERRMLQGMRQNFKN